MNEDNKYKVLLEQNEHVLKTILEGIRALSDDSSMVSKLEATFEVVGKLKIDMPFVKDELRSIKNSLSEKITRVEYIALEKRILFLEKKLNV